MAALEDHVSSDRVVALGVGINGTGKTGSLESLARAGYKIRLADCDNGAEILRNQLRGTEFAKNVDVETCQDVYVGAAGNPLPKTPLVGFNKLCKVLDNWPGLGKPSEWGTDTVLALDSLTFSGRWIMNHVLAMNAWLGKNPQLQHWGVAMEMQESLLAMLTGSALKCHVIVFSHITFLEQEGDVTKQGLPSALGSKLPPKVGTYFNTTLHYDFEGLGSNRKRVIRTKATGNVATKTSAPGKVKAFYPIETGLAEYFEAIYGPLQK